MKAVLVDKRFASACVGMDNISHLAANASAGIDKPKLTEADKLTLKQYAQATCSGYCAGCANICKEAMPDVPYVSDIMRYLMYNNCYGQKDRARKLFAQIPASVRGNLLSQDYTRAEARCPQHLPIRALVAEAVERLA
jgi:predicted aldo/keto reductase-like oxidoreductase